MTSKDKIVVNKKAARASDQKRTEMISVRLAPKLRFAADLAARSQRRSISSLVEVAVAAYLPTLVVIEPADPEDEREMKLTALVAEVWDPDESDRFVLLAEGYRWLLNNEEEHLWKAIREHFDAKGRLTLEQRKTLRPIYGALKKKVADALDEKEGAHFAKGRK
jgi:hypothetical protein